MLTDGNNKFINHNLSLSLDIFEDENGKEWFLGSDVAKFFGFRDTTNMTRLITDPDEHTRPHNMRGVRGNEYTAVMIDEYALYEITIKIRKTDTSDRYNTAKMFRDWVFGEVLPKLRKNKAYIDSSLMISEEDAKKAVDDALEYAREEIARNREQILFLKTELAEAEQREIMDYMLEPMLADFKEELDHQRYRYNKLETDYEKLKKIVESYAIKEVNDMRQRNGLPDINPENKVEFLREFENVKLNKSILDIFPIDIILSKV